MVRLARTRREAAPSTDPSTDPPDPSSGGALAAVPLLARAAHLRLGAITAVVMAVAAALSGREPREVALVLVTVFMGGLILGWHNDLVDRHRDQRHQVPDKPVADGRLDPGTVWFALTCAVLLLVPLTVTNGITAGSAYLVSVLIGVLGNVVLRQGLLSWVPWAAAYALLPAFLSYGGWGGQSLGDPPRILMTVLAALLGVGVHVLTGLFGLVPEDADGWRSLPLRLGQRLGSARLLTLTSVYLVVVSVALILGALLGGLAQ